MTEHKPYDILAAIRDDYRKDYEFAVAPLRDEERQQYDGALKWADAGVKALFGLNGGGLIALPTFAALFKTDMRAAGLWVLLAAVGYVIGLFSATVTCLLGYLSAMTGKEATGHVRAAVGWKYARHYQQVETPPEMIEQQIKDAEEAAARCTTRSIRLRKAAVVISIIGLIAFCAAACFAWHVLADVPAIRVPALPG